MSPLQFQQKLKECKYCKDVLGLQFEPRPVVWGKEMAPIVIIGQAPSLSASLSGRPFSKDLSVDASGRRLVGWLGVSEEVFFNQEIFYITGVAHCYPGRGKGGDLPPPRVCAEMWLEEELSYLSPKIFIILGRHAVIWAFPKMPFEKLVFGEMSFRGKPAVVLPHPSPANKGWLKRHPKVERRLVLLREMVRRVLEDQS